MTHDLFHTNCPNTRGIAPHTGADFFFGRYILSSDEHDHAVMSQVRFECDGCGAKLHIDIWPQGPVDPADWRTEVAKREPSPHHPPAFMLETTLPGARNKTFTVLRNESIVDRRIEYSERQNQALVIVEHERGFRELTPEQVASLTAAVPEHVLAWARSLPNAEGSIKS